MRLFPLVGLASLALLGCSSPSSRSGATVLYLAEYDLGLVSVDRPGGRLDVPPENRYLYEDDLMSTIFVAREDRISFEIENRADRTLRVLWDESAFIDTDGNSSRVMHSGVAPAVRYLPQAPGVVPVRSRYSDFVVPADRVRYREPFDEGGVAVPAGWESLPLVLPLVNEVPAEEAQEELPTANTVFRSQVNGNRGKRLGLLLTVQVGSAKTEYTFWFEILESRVTGPATL